MDKCAQQKIRSQTRSPEQASDTTRSHLQDEPEHGGPPGPEPTRYGDWERNGRCIDF